MFNISKTGGEDQHIEMRGPSVEEFWELRVLVGPGIAMDLLSSVHSEDLFNKEALPNTEMVSLPHWGVPGSHT